MNTVKKHLLYGVLISVSMSTPSIGHAFPNMDEFQLGSEIKKAYQDVRQGLEKENLQKTIKDLSSELAKIAMDNVNNAVANTIARGGAAKQAINELKIAQQQQVDINLCSNISYSFNLGNIGCEQEDEANKESYSYLANSPLFSDDPGIASREAKRLTYEVMIRSPELFLKDPEYQTDIEEATSVFDVGLLVSDADETLNLTADQQDAMKTMIQIVTPSFTASKVDVVNTSQKQQLNQLSKELPGLAARQVLLKTLQLRSQRSDGTPSDLATYQEIVNSFNDPVAIHAISNGNVTTPYSLKRSQLFTKAHEARVQLANFKSSLRMEGIEALKLLEHLK